MAFNLEFKITYDELSPSLQDMFKSLQGQITDNRNEITNINMDITDISNEITEINNEINTINNHLTQIDNSITNINENIQNIENDITNIEGNITDLGDQITEINNNITIINDKLEEVDPDTISNLDFLNLAPKIGYYQDDTVEVISKYNCNYIPQNAFNYPASYAITTDNLNREVIYFCANDGSYEAFRDDQWNLYKADRSNDQESFIFHNEALVPKCFEGQDFNVSRVLSADNEYIILCLKPDTKEGTTNYNTHGWMILTHNSSDPKDWDEKIDLSFINFSFSFSGFRTKTDLIRYFPDKNKLVVIRTYNSQDNLVGYFEVWDMNSKTKKCSINIPLFNDRIVLQDPWSFSSTSKIQSYNQIVKRFNGESWRKNGFLYLYDEDLLKINYNPAISVYNTSTTTVSSWYLLSTFVYKVPKSILDNYSGSITLLNSTTDNTNGLYNYSSTHPLTNASMNVVACNMSSYDTQNKRFYFYGATDRDSTDIIAYRIKNQDQAEGIANKVIYRGWYAKDSTSIIYLGNIVPIDSSLWGKGWRSNITAENLFYLCGRSCTGFNKGQAQNPIIVDQFQKYKNAPGDNSTLVIEPAPGHYRLGNAFTNVYKMSFNVISNTTTRLFRINSYDNKFNIIEYKTIPFRDGSKDQFTTTVYKDWNTNISFSDLLSYSGYLMRNQNALWYNYFEDLIIVLFQYPNTNGSKWRMCFGLKIWSLKQNKLLHFFTPEELNNKVPAYNKFVTENTVKHPNDIITYTASACIWLNSTTILLYIFHQNNSRNDSWFRPIMLQFNSTFTDIVSSNTIINGGQQLGLPYIGYNCCQWSNWGLTYQTISKYSGILLLYTQKPVISGYGNKNYSTNEVIIDSSKMNQYVLYIQSAQGLICYIPSTNIFLGGYYTVIDTPISVNLTANATNYIYLERGEDRDTINAYATTILLYYEGQRLFSKICVAKIVTDSINITSVEYYRINIGYNDYVWNGGGVTEVINELVASGSEGQILKIRQNSITPDNNFRVLRVVDNDTDFNEESKTVVTMKSIFNTWSRHNVFVRDVIFGGEIGLNDSGNWKNGYDVNPTAANWTFIEPNYIKNSNNQSPFSMFISNDTFSDHEITLFCHRLDYDDDMLIWIIAWAENTSVGGFDTLSIIKMDTYQNPYTNGNNTYNTGVPGDRKMVYRLVLNLGTSRQFSIVNEDKLINTTLCRDQSKGRDYKLYVKRTGRTITWKISALGPNDPDQCPLLDSTTISYTFPNTKPDGWTDDNWNIVQKLLGSPQKVGVGTLSQPCQFTILESSLFNDVDIYRLDKDAIYSYDSSSFKYVDSGRKISDAIPLHSWIYNKTTKKLFHFSSANNYTLIDH